MDLERRFEAAMGPGEPDAPAVLGVSGGVDSLALLHLMAWLRTRRKFDLYVVHVHHGLRGAEADADAEFVETECKKLSVPCEVAHVDVPALAKEHGWGIEEAARRARYSAMVRTLRRVGSDLIYTAHTADDQAETIMMHLLRGSGLSGLKGMYGLAFVSASHLIDADTEAEADLIIRPLLGFWRSELAEYCLAKGLQPRQDSSNADPRYFRNRVRLEVLPYLESLAPGFRERLWQLSQIASAQDESYAELLDLFRIQIDWTTGVDLKGFRSYGRAAQRYLLHRYIPLLDFDHLEAICDLVEFGQTGGYVFLPRGWRARIAYGQLYIDAPGKLSPEERFPRLPEDPVKITGPRSDPLITGPRLLVQRVKQAPSGEIEGWLLAPETLTLPLILRTRRHGDRLYLPGVGTQKLSDFLINRKVPRDDRDHLPLLIMGDRVIGVWGLWTQPEHRAAPGQPAWRITLRRD